MKVIRDSSFTYFIYPILFNPKRFKIINDNLSSANYKGQSTPKTVWKKCNFPEDELMPHLANYLNTDLNDSDKATANLWELENDALFSHRFFGGKSDWKVISPNCEIPIQFESVQMALFQVGVGFLTFAIKPNKKDASLDDWIDLIHYFRFADGKRDVELLISRVSGFDEKLRMKIIHPYFPEIGGGLEKHPDGSGNLNDIIEGLLETAIDAKWWDDVFISGQLIPYSGLFVRNVESEKTSKTLFRLKNFFRSKNLIIPSENELEYLKKESIQYAKGQWFYFSLEGGGFFASDPPDTEFFRITLPVHLKTQYYLLLILALHQRFFLINLKDSVAEKFNPHQKDFNSKEMKFKLKEIFDAMQLEILFFTSRGYYPQVMQREHHHRCYKKWIECFQIKELFEEVNTESIYIQNYFANEINQINKKFEENKLKQSKKLERLLNLIASVFGIPALTLSFLALINPISNDVVVYSLLLSLITGGTIFVVMEYFSKKLKVRNNQDNNT